MKILIAAAIVFAFFAGGVTTYFVFAEHSSAVDPDDAVKPADKSDGIPVQTGIVREGNITETATAYGTVEAPALATIVLSVPYEVQVKRINVRVGQSVAAGDAVIEIGPSPDAILQLKQSEEAMAAAQANEQQVRQRLTEQLATNADLAQAVQATRNATTQLQSLQYRGVGELRAINASEASVVDQVNVQTDQIVAAAAPLVVLRPVNKLEVKLNVNPGDIAALRPGATVTLLPIGLGSVSRPLTGIVESIMPQVNAQTRMRDVLVALPEKTEPLQGEFVTGTWAMRTATGLLVPRVAVHQVDDQWVVYVVEGGKAKAVAVELGLQDDDSSQISGQLKAGDTIITTSNGDLEDGTAVAPAVVAASQPVAGPQ